MIHIGSTNKSKIEAVQELFLNYEQFKDQLILTLDIPSAVSEQPTSLEETVTGAIHRATSALNRGIANQDKIHSEKNYGIGIEDGIMQVPHTITGYLNVCVVCIHFEEKNYIGLSSAYEYPQEVVDLLINKKYDINQAFLELGYTNHPRLGSAQGAIHLLTDGRLDRKGATMEGLRNALIGIEKAYLKKMSS